MLPGNLHVDLRDKSVVRVLRVIPAAKEHATPLVEVVDIMKRCDYLVDAEHLSPRAVDPDSVMDWIKRG